MVYCYGVELESWKREAGLRGGDWGKDENSRLFSMF